MSDRTIAAITDKMSGLCAQLEKADSLSEAEQENLVEQAIGVCEDLDHDYGVPAFRPEVPEATVTMFFRLTKLAGLQTHRC